ncbi:MAG: hypothetical protein LBQ55_04200, partial [Treponema sp.]|nr:hypothetical protein [Treponema sp.]
MNIITMGIHRSEKVTGPERREIRFSAAEDAAKLVPNGKTGAVTIGSWSLGELLDLAGAGAEARRGFDGADLYVHCGGWQSWSAGWELRGGQTLPRKVRFVPDLIKCTNREGDTPPPGWTAGHFIMYIRSGEHYLCAASRDGGLLPPVSYRIALGKKAGADRAVVSAEIFCPGKTWKPG